MYDAGEDILFLSRGRKVRASIEVGDFIIDVDMKGFITGIEIHNASQNLGIAENQLESLQDITMSISYKPNYVYIFMLFKVENQETHFGIPLTVDLGHASVRTEKARFAVT